MLQLAAGAPATRTQGRSSTVPIAQLPGPNTARARQAPQQPAAGDELRAPACAADRRGAGELLGAQPRPGPARRAVDIAQHQSADAGRGARRSAQNRPERGRAVHRAGRLFGGQIE
jgi:hypothetical protein